MIRATRWSASSRFLQRHKLKVLAIVSTHTHIDHVGGLAALHRLTGAPVFMHEGDLELYRKTGYAGAVVARADAGVDGRGAISARRRFGALGRLRSARDTHAGAHARQPLPLHSEARSGDAEEPQASAQRLRGHGEIARRAAGNGGEESRLIAGDTLFAGSIGRTDLWGGSFPEIMKSLHTKVMALPDETLVLPGHGEATTIGEERQSNPFLRPR